METDILLEVLDSQNISTSSQNPDNHDDSDLLNTVPEETNESNHHVDVIKGDEIGTIISWFQVKLDLQGR